jgi:tetratricopeptide (TPR) repeat protein
MPALTAGNADIAEEVELGRTLLLQGHLETAQRVLLKLCQQQPECAEALRTLGMVLSKRGDDQRAQCLLDYAAELETQAANAVPAHVEDAPSDAETRKNQLRLAPVRPLAKAAATPVAVPLPPPPTPAPVALSPPPAPPVVLTLPVVPPASLPIPAKRRRGGVLLAFFAGVALVAGGVAAYSYYGSLKPPRPSPRVELDRALAAGTLEALMRGRDVARISLETGPTDPDSWVRFGLVNAFLVLDYDVDAKKDAERALERAGQGPAEASKERTALAATARALLALAAGDRAAAKQQTEIALALDSAPPVYALLASARVNTLAGDGAAAARDLDRAMGIAGDVAPVMVDWAGSRLDQGDPVAARRSLLALLEKNAEYSRARLLLAEAERALGESSWTKSLDLACKSDAKISRNVRALCSVGSALQARLEGDRGGALRKAKAASQTTEDPQALAQISLLMALLGEIDAADEVLGRAAKSADPSAPPLRWADLAIRLGRGEKGETLPAFEHPAGPERDLVALRAAFARSGSSGLAAVFKALPPGIADIDPEVRTFAKLEREASLTKADATALEKRAERWNPMASYVLGVFALREKDPKLAARRLEKALAWHGDACAAAALYVDAVGRAGKPAQLNKAQLRALHARNAKCPLPDI